MAAEPRNDDKQPRNRAPETHSPARGVGGGRGTPSSPEEARGDQLRREFDAPIPSVTTMVCLTCGAEQFFEEQIPTNLKCARCASTVFRPFDTPTVRDEATIAHLEEEARSIQYGDASPQTAPEDVRDLEMK
jgi:DNA-directed RNA polymerase subunit RPC12/RpoP